MFPVESKALPVLLWESLMNPEPGELAVVAKYLYLPEERRQREPQILDKVYKLAKKDQKALGHWHVDQEMIWFKEHPRAHISR